MKWQDLDAKRQRNPLILMAIVAAMFVILLWPSGRAHTHPTRIVDPYRGPQTGRVTPPPAPRPTPPPPPRDLGMLGAWQANGTVVPGHGLCTVSLQLAKDTQQPGNYTGAASISCIPIASFEAPKSTTPFEVMLAQRDALNASLTGTWAKDAIVFHVDRVMNPKQCGLTGFSVSKFGSVNLAAEFQDACGGGSAVMRKTG